MLRVPVTSMTMFAMVTALLYFHFIIHRGFESVNTFGQVRWQTITAESKLHQNNSGDDHQNGKLFFKLYIWLHNIEWAWNRSTGLMNIYLPCSFWNYVVAENSSVLHTADCWKKDKAHCKEYIGLRFCAHFDGFLYPFRDGIWCNSCQLRGEKEWHLQVNWHSFTHYTNH